MTMRIRIHKTPRLKAGLEVLLALRRIGYHVEEREFTRLIEQSTIVEVL